jgi:hypothetical protein
VSSCISNLEIQYLVLLDAVRLLKVTFDASGNQQHQHSGWTLHKWPTTVLHFRDFHATDCLYVSLAFKISYRRLISGGV